MSPIREELATLKAEMLERFEKEAQENGWAVCDGRGPDRYDLDAYKAFLSTSIDQAFAAGREAGIGEVREAVRKVLLEEGWPKVHGGTLVKVTTALANLTKPDKE